MNSFKIIMLLLITIGCSSLSKEECQNTNWQSRGKSDALRGINEPRNEGYQNDCSEHGVTVDSTSYMKGYNEGLDLFCTYQNGYNLGVKSGEQHLYCQKRSPEFAKGLKEGTAIYHENNMKAQAVEDLKNQLISINGAMECPSSSICERQTSCRFNRCVHNGSRCTFDQDCNEIGQCIPVTGYTSYGDLASVKVCRFLNNY